MFKFQIKQIMGQEDESFVHREKMNPAFKKLKQAE